MPKAASIVVPRPPLDQRLDAAEAGGVADQPHATGTPARRRRPTPATSKAIIAPNPAWSRAAIAWPGSAGRPGIAHSGRRAGARPAARRARRRWPARAPSAAPGCAGRGWPGSVSSAPGHGAGERPPRRAAPSASVGRRATTSAPISTSECPDRYFVTECMTTSAPSSSGRTTSGVENVASTHDQRAAPCAAAAIARAGRARSSAGWSPSRARAGRRRRAPRPRRRCRRCRPAARSSGRARLLRAKIDTVPE